MSTHPPLTDTVTWCPTRNAYADPSCGTAPGTSHGHYDVETDPLTGAVLTSPAVQYERRRLASYFVAPDADGETWLWRGQPGDARPQLVVSRDLFTNDLLLWDHLTVGLDSITEGQL